MADEVQQGIQMIQLTGQGIGATVRAVEVSGRAIIAALKALSKVLAVSGKGVHHLHRQLTTEQSFKSLNEFASKTGATLVEEKIADRDVKAIKHELTRHGVDFAIYKDHNGETRIFVKAANEATMRVALEKVIADHAREEQAQPEQEDQQPEQPQEQQQEPQPSQEAEQPTPPPHEQPDEPAEEPEQTKQTEQPEQPQETQEPNQPAPEAEPPAPSKEPTLEDAIDIVVKKDKVSVSSLQKELGLSYSKTARLVDQMEELGVVSPLDGRKPREVLITKEQWAGMKERGINPLQPTEAVTDMPKAEKQPLDRFDDRLKSATQKANAINKAREAEHQKAVARAAAQMRHAGKTR